MLYEKSTYDKEGIKWQIKMKFQLNYKGMKNFL